MKYDYQLVIIGAGSGGITAAEFAGKLGLTRVALVEKDKRLGGECLHTGCVPSKALLHAAKHGVKDPWKHVKKSIDFIEKRTDNAENIESHGVKVITGAAEFEDKHTIKVGRKKITSKYFLITTGSSPFVPPIPGIEDVKYRTNESIFSLKKAPKSLAIIGSGPIGIEMATAFSALGTKVTVIERGDKILGRLDQEAADLVVKGLKKAGVTLLTGVMETSVSNEKKLIAIKAGKKSFKVEELLVATGRKPNTGSLQLENAGIKYDRTGILIDKYLRTNKKNIYAVGDVTPSPKFTHTAGNQAAIALANMITPLYNTNAQRLQVAPAITFSWPEVGSFGMTVDEAMKVDGAKILHYNLTENDRAVTDEEADGFVKVVVDKKGRLLSGVVAAGNAAELMGPLLLMYGNKKPITTLSHAVFPYPTVLGSLSLINADYGLEKVLAIPGWNRLTKKWKK